MWVHQWISPHPLLLSKQIGFSPICNANKYVFLDIGDSAKSNLPVIKVNSTTWSAWTHLTHTFYDGVFFVHTSLKSLADTTVSSAFFALSGAKNLLGQKRNLIMSKHFLRLFVMVPGIHYPKRFNHYMQKALAVNFNWRIHYCTPKPGQCVPDHRFSSGNSTSHFVQMVSPPL